MEAGLSVVHLFGKPTERLDREAVIAAVKAAEADDCQVLTAAMLGHKADVAFMALAPDWRTLRTFQSALRDAGVDIVDSYVSITEVSEYAKGMPEEMLRGAGLPAAPAGGAERVLLLPDEQEARRSRQLVRHARSTSATS